jgi:general secretion pathway protein I
MNRNRTLKIAGFTLIEVLAAMAIAAIGLLALARTMASSVEVSIATETRTVAYWVAGNHMAKLRLARTWPGTGTSQQEETMGGRQWRVVRNITATADADVVRVEIDVFESEANTHSLARLNGYLARLEPARFDVADPPTLPDTGAGG